MTKKIFAVLMAVSVMLSALVCGFAMAEGTTETPTDVVVNVTFDANGGEGTMEAIDPVDGEVTAPECAFTKTGYNFLYWNTLADGSGTNYEPGEKVAAKEAVILFAQWAKDGFVEYYITYDANGGEGEVVDDWSYIADTVTNTCYNDFVREGYEFKEWNTKADGTGTAYAEGDEITVVDSDIVLYAIWTGGEEDPGTEDPGTEDPGTDDPGTEDPGTEVPDVEEPTDEEPTDEEIIDEEIDDTIPATGDASATVVALATGIVALGALVVLKKKN